MKKLIRYIRSRWYFRATGPLFRRMEYIDDRFLLDGLYLVALSLSFLAFEHLALWILGLL